MAATQPVAIIIVAWNSGMALRAAIDSAYAQAPAEVVVVDNHSTDHSIVPLRRLYPQLRIVALAHNTGFAAACNIGVGASCAPYLLFLNDDAVLGPNYVATLIAALAKDSRAASAVGKITYVQDGVRRIDSAGLRLDRYALRPMDRGQGERDEGQFDTPAQVFGPTGAAALYRRAALLAAGEGGFDSSLFAYYEDVDLAWRLGNRGWTHLYEPMASASHARRGPGGKPAAIRAQAFVNRYTVWAKNDSAWQFALHGAVAVPWELARLARRAGQAPRGTWQLVCAAPKAIARGLAARRRQRRQGAWNLPFRP